MAWEKTCNHVSVKGQVSRKYKRNSTIQFKKLQKQAHV